MALYLVVHSPSVASEEAVRPPSRLAALAQASLEPGVSPRWLKTWSPDLHDDRQFTLWEAESAADVEAMLQRFGFLDDMAALPLRVREWGPADVIGAEAAGPQEGRAAELR